MARSSLALIGALLLVSTVVLGRNLKDKPVPRVVNGDDASVGDFPFLVRYVSDWSMIVKMHSTLKRILAHYKDEGDYIIPSPAGSDLGNFRLRR